MNLTTYEHLFFLVVLGALAGAGYVLTKEKHPQIALIFATLALAVIILAGRT